MSGYDLSRPVLDRLREAADIVAVVGEYLTLRKTGRNHVGLCPFHGEKTPSFSVSREKGTYYCFGCKRGGDVIDFVMEMERVAFPEAVERLARQFGVELPPASPASRRRREEQDVLAELLEAAQNLFFRRLGDDAPRAFLERRGISATVAAEFGLGYAPDAWRDLHDVLVRKYPEEQLVASGLIVRGERGRLWDRFRNRVTIPIRNHRGTIVAFGGRALGDDPPKYLNSPETALFSKSHVLFAMDRAARAFGKTDRAIVVEGYFDCIALHHSGFTDAVATLGTALTEHHVRDLARKVARVVVCFDGDDAGRQAALSAVRTLLAADVDTSVLLLPEGQDPDDVVRRGGAEAFSSLLDGALSVAELLVRQLGTTLAERRGRLPAVLDIADGAANPVRRFALKEELARAAGVPVGELGHHGLPVPSAARAGEDDLASAPGEWALLRAVLVDLPEGRRRDLLTAMDPLTFEHPVASRILRSALEIAEAGGVPETAALMGVLDDPRARRCLAGLEHAIPPTNPERLGEVLRKPWEKTWKRRMAEARGALDRAQREGDEAAVGEILERINELMHLKRDRDSILARLEPLLRTPRRP